MSAKKKSCFQITSVTQAQVATVGGTDDSESLDDPDESRTEDTSSEIYEPEVCDRRSSASHVVGEGESAAHRVVHPVQSHQPVGPVQQAAAATTTPATTASTTTCSSRFRVIKLDHGTGEPFRRGRWTCTEFYERESEVVTSRTAEVTRHPSEHGPERDSGLGASVVVQSGQVSDVSTTTTSAAAAASLHDLPASVHPFESANEPSKLAQSSVPSQAHLAPGLNQGSHIQKSAVTPQTYPNQPQQSPQLPLGLHMPSQTSMTPEYGQQHLPQAISMQGEIGVSIPASQSGASVPNLIDWVGVISTTGMAPLTPAPSVQVGQYSGVAMTPGQNSPVPGVVGILLPEQSRRKSDAAASAPVKETGKPLTAEESPLMPTPGVSSLFGIPLPLPIDGDEDSASGTSVVAIDNKIEKAMDLVKSHLMYAVREEVEVLKEQIKDLCERNSVLERENAVLKSLANSEQLSQLSAHTASTSSPTPASSVPPQPSVSSA